MGSDVPCTSRRSCLPSLQRAFLASRLVLSSVELDGSSLDGDRSGALDRHLGALDLELGCGLKLEVGSRLELHVRIGGDLDVAGALDGHLAAAGDLVCRLRLEKKHDEPVVPTPQLDGPIPALAGASQTVPSARQACPPVHGAGTA